MKTEAFENGAGKSVISYRFHQRFRSFSVDDGQKLVKKYSFSYENGLVDRWKQNENASVAENILLRFRWNENEYLKTH